MWSRAVASALVVACTVAAVAFVGGGSAARIVRSRAQLPNNGLAANGGFIVSGRPAFLIALANPPPLHGTTPDGGSGLRTVVRAGVNLLRVGPAWTGWTRREVEQALAWERAAMRLGVHTWVRLNAFAATRPNWRGDARLAAVVHALTRSRYAAGLGLWQGADEPLTRGIHAGSLAFLYCRLSSRRQARACEREPTLDRHHPLVTILAPSGTPAELAPYRRVSDTLGVDVYPVTLATRNNPDLHAVGRWTREIATLAQRDSVWTTLQICSRHSWDKQTGAYVQPTAYQERYMVYDAIINGARGIAFFGGDNRHCWTRTDSRYGWNWTFWRAGLGRLIAQIGARSPLGSALSPAAANRVLATSDPGTEAISRDTRSRALVWVIAARSTPGRARVAISGLPDSATSATVYGEGRTVRITDGMLTDSFGRWQVHVYRIRFRTRA